MANRTVLMISYWYPPTPGAGAQRAAGFARHLSAYGWSPVVVAAGDPIDSAEPESAALKEGPVTVFRIPDIRSPASVLVDYAGAPRVGLLRQLVKQVLVGGINRIMQAHPADLRPYLSLQMMNDRVMIQ